MLGLQTADPDYGSVQVGQVTVIAPTDRLTLGIAMGEVADQPATWPGLGQRIPGPIRLMLVPDQAGFDRISRGRLPSWGAGLAFPGARTIVVRIDGGEPMAALRHELAHLALHEAVRSRLPLWFDEGYAVVAAGEWDRMAALQLNLAVAQGKVPALWALDASLRRGAGEAEAAYALAGSAVAELARRNPSGTLDALVGRLEAGEGFEAAVLATTGLTLDRFDGVWHRTVRQRYNLVLWLVAGGGWGLLGLATVAIVVVRRRRDLPRRMALNVGWEIPTEIPEEEPASLDQGS